MNPLCCIAPVSIDRDRTNPVVTKSGPQCQQSIETSIRTVNYSSKPSFSSQVFSINVETDKSSPLVTNHASEALFDEPIIGEVTAIHGVAGILYKWVNYGKGWRSRWFVLEDGVLSYYKVHGPDKILMSPAREKSVRVIGEDSIRYMSKANWSSNRVNSAATQCKPFGEIHLKVSSIRASKSDDKRLTIFTGTKTLHLCCLSREDRTAWIEALLAAKDLFPRVLSNNDFQPSEEVVIPTDMLRSRLLQEALARQSLKTVSL